MTASKGRTVVANISLSLDGRISGPGGEYDMSWIVPHAISEGARAHMVEVTAPATTALLGRKNYQGFGGFWPAVAGDENAHPHDRTFSRWLNEVDKVVFSRTLDALEWDNARLATADPATVVKHLRQEDGGDIIVLASTSVIRQLLDADEVDRLSITLCPELVGGGERLFTDGLGGTSWALTSSKATETGALCQLYDRIRD
ncbi:dihydrofolate reductase family protein [Kutzneria buriramensis]|uniref:Dihydrofolate reductase n=1 Tax=Kutzneria buriramensis TaxID=1045776 RepID=A0A3E0HIJ1_9PSEU|nr:dihydrofolate reductase family protein [Kutzneria buriramensis]REH46309.1 dihydrofolate reductase [Kutzneria buriramensis]